MSLRDVSDVDPGVHTGDELFVVLAALVEHLEPLKGRSIEIFWFFNCMNHRLNSVNSLERWQRRKVRVDAYSKNLPKVISRWLSVVVDGWLT